jgi:ABC-type uncharacterized transport system substrate-binding protein
VKRREFIALVGTTAAWPFLGRAQQAGMPVIGFLHFASAETYAHLVAAFLQALRESAFVEGQNVRIEYRWANGEYDRLPALAVDLVNQQVAAIVAGGVLAAQAATAATTTIPIVFNSGVDPVTVGIVASLSRPGGNVTGVSSITLELGVKRLELLLEVMPKARVVALLINPDNPGGEREVTEVTEAAARALGLEIRKLRARNERDLDAAFTGLKTSPVDALIVGNDGYFTHRREQITNLGARQGVPTIYPRREFVAAGGLISYSNSLADAYRLVGIYVAKILKGAKPVDLPVVQPTKFELVINLTTAKALGLTIPQSILLRADEVIE